MYIMVLIYILIEIDLLKTAPLLQEIIVAEMSSVCLVRRERGKDNPGKRWEGQASCWRVA